MNADTTERRPTTRQRAAGPFKGKARSVKAYRLVEALDAVAVAKGQDPFSDLGTLDSMAQLVGMLDERMWGELARQRGVNPPSDRTIVEVRSIYARRARLAQQACPRGRLWSAA